MKKRGFTLIELLVVVAIISVLVAILLPSLGAARRRAKTSRCLASVRGMGHALQLYMADWGAMFPFSTNPDIFWVKLLGNQSVAASGGYGGSEKMRTCAEATTPMPGASTNNTVGNAHYQWYPSALTGSGEALCSSYAINGWVYNIAATPGDSTGTLYSAVASSHNDLYFNLKTTNSTSQIPVFFDCNYRHIWAFPGDQPPSGSNNLEDNGPNSTTGAVDHVHPLTRAVMNRHDMAINVVFADGHGDTVKLQQLWGQLWYKGWLAPTPPPPLPNR